MGFFVMTMSNYSKLLVFLLTLIGHEVLAQSSMASPLQVLSQQGPNLSSWVLAPIDRNIPDTIRQNITFLREDLLDEGKTKPQAPRGTYSVAYQFCSSLIAVLDEREKMLIKAGYRAAHANVVTPTANQALEARRNYLMSWPQYELEIQKRNDLLRLGEAADKRKVELAIQELKLEWAQRGDVLRANLDALYIKLRAALRDNGGGIKPLSGANSNSPLSVPSTLDTPSSEPSSTASKTTAEARKIDQLFIGKSWYTLAGAEWHFGKNGTGFRIYKASYPDKIDLKWLKMDDGIIKVFWRNEPGSPERISYFRFVDKVTGYISFNPSDINDPIFIEKNSLNGSR